jgi:hypothetical protein
MSLYASGTLVSSEKSKMEIERTLRRYGAAEFVQGWDADKAVIMFRMGGRRIRFYLPLPDKNNFRKTPSGRERRNEYAIEEAWEQAGRQRWRALALAIKAKLEAVESGITTFEEEFLAHVVMPNGQNLGAVIVPQIAEAYEKKRMPPLLGSGV